MITCPKSACEGPEFASVGALAAHLVTFHLLAAGVALDEARRAAKVVNEATFGAAPPNGGPPTSLPPDPAKTKEPTMPDDTTSPARRCSACGKTGHRKGNPFCSTPGGSPDRCGYCKHVAPGHSDTCKRATAAPARGGRKRKAITKNRPLPKPKASTNGTDPIVALLRTKIGEAKARVEALEAALAAVEA